MTTSAQTPNLADTHLWPITSVAHPSPTSAERRAEILASPGFGKYYTDHMVRATWTEDEGWHDAELVPYQPLTFDPATDRLGDVTLRPL
jgi:branched-chain amino acid aminotransferase